MNRLLKLCVLPAALGLVACGASSSAMSGASTPSAAMSEGATAALGSKLGISPALVEKALAAAKAALSGANQHTEEEKTLAAQLGVDTAARDAEAAGEPLAVAQKTGLLEGIRGML